MSAIEPRMLGSLGRIISTCRRRLVGPTVVLAAMVAGVCSWGSKAAGEVITTQSFRLEIATNLVWMDNKNNPTVALLDEQLNCFDQQIAQANPYLRITNLTNDSRIVAAQLNLANSSARISNVEWLETPGQATWYWDTVHNPNHAMFNFIDPILPGKTASMRLTTAEDRDGYVLYQNLFQPMFTLDGAKAQYGIVTLSIQQTVSAEQVQFDAYGDPIGAVFDPAPVYDLADPVQTPRVSYGYDPTVNTFGIESYAQIQPVPEPGTLAMAGMASAVLGLWGFFRRLRLGGLGKA
jgi:hypothetical protein